MYIRFICALSLLVVCFACFGLQVEIENPSFELPVVADGSFEDPNIPGWIKEKPLSVYRILNPSDNYPIQPVEGDNLLWLSPAGATASLTQVTDETIKADTFYEFNVSIGCLSGNFGYDLSLHAYYTVVLYATDGSSYQVLYTSGAKVVDSPNWNVLSARFSSADFPETVGKKFKILLAGKKVMFDDVRITYGSLKQLEIQVSPFDAGIDSVLPTVGTYSCYEGEIVDLEAFSYVICPDIYSFTGWVGDVADSGLPITTITMDTDKTITANFVLDQKQCQEIQTDIAFENKGFETPVVEAGGYEFLTEMEGWNIDANDVTYTLYNSTSNFKATEGSNHIAFQLSGAGSGQISQVSTDVIKADTVYCFSFDVAAYDLSGYYLFSLYYSPKTTAHLLATTDVSTLDATYQWKTVTLLWDSSTAPELVGQNFEIVLAGKKMFFDNFRCYEQKGLGITNPSFERPVVDYGGYAALTSLYGWNIDANDVNYYLYNSSSSFKASDQSNHIGFQLVGAGSGQLSQTLLGEIQPNTEYTFSFDAAAYDLAGFYLLSLYYEPLSPSHLITTTGAAYLSSTYQWQTISLQWDSTDYPELVGKKLRIVLAGKKMFFDNVRVTPEGKWKAMMDLDISTEPAGLMEFVHPSTAQSSYEYGSIVNVSAASEVFVCPDRYLFQGWVEDGFELGDSNSAVLLANSDKSMTAKYEMDPDYNPECGSLCRPIVDEDINKDCNVNLYDYAELAAYWLATVD